MQAILPPVRRPVPLGSRRASESLDNFFVGHGVRVLGSGTQALALAIKDSAVRSRSSRPEVILPAYGCPNLIAASVHAGVRPRLVDIAKGQWGYDLDQLAAALSKDTVAIVAVNLLGVGDQADRLREIATPSAIPLIQDSAQHLPQDLPVSWRGEYIVFSFGRGKPLNLLRGGVLGYILDTAPVQHCLANSPLPVGVKRMVAVAPFRGSGFQCGHAPLGLRARGPIAGCRRGRYALHAARGDLLRVCRHDRSGRIRSRRLPRCSRV